MKTYLDRNSFQYKLDTAGGSTFEKVAVYQVPRERLLALDSTRPAILAFFAAQTGLTQDNNKKVTLPNGLVLPANFFPLACVQAFGTVNNTRRQLTVTDVDEAASQITIDEKVDANTTVDVYAVPRMPMLVEFRIAPPKAGLDVSRTIFTMDISADFERDIWKSGSQLRLPTGYVLPEDWLLEIWVRCPLPIKWTLTSPPGAEVKHIIAIPVILDSAPGAQDAIKKELLESLIK